MSYVLHQFPFSPFCEKVRLTLAYKDLEYAVRSHFPILHRFSTYHLSKQIHLPVLVVGEKVISESNSIMLFLDRENPKPGRLFPESNKDLHLMQTFIQKMDVAIGVSLYHYVAHHVLKNSKVGVSFFTGHDFTQRERVIFRLSSSFVFPWLRRMMHTGPVRAERARKRLFATLDTLDQKIKKRSYLFGKKISAADIAVAALLVPLSMPPESSFGWEERSPQELLDLHEKNRGRPIIIWAREMYREIVGGINE